jgi:hypothetical protein
LATNKNKNGPNYISVCMLGEEEEREATRDRETRVGKNKKSSNTTTTTTRPHESSAQHSSFFLFSFFFLHT